jgi:phage regulator Rha-like protein
VSKKEEVNMKDLIPQEMIEDKIYLIRGKKVMFDSDLAKLYGIETYQLTRQVRRNIDRFPEDFMFQLTKEEFLSCRIGSSKKGGRRYLPYVFTREGVAMLSSVLNSKRAIQVNIVIMRVFAKLREMLYIHKELLYKLKELEHKVEKHDTDIETIFEVIRQLMATPPEPTKRRIGFHP